MLLVLGGVVLFYDDKQQRGDLLKEQQANALLTQEIADRDAQLTTLQARARQLGATYFQSPSINSSLARPARSAGNAGPTQDPESLDRPAYK